MNATLSEFKERIKPQLMVLEAILAEVYSGYVAGELNFSLFDGGAHKGYHTTRMADLPGCARVYAVEADPYTANTLRASLNNSLKLKRQNVIVVEAALQDDSAVDSISWKSSPSHVGRSSIVSQKSERDTIWGNNPEMKYRDEFSVAATTIDALLAPEALPLPFLKLDLEGADLLALKGAVKTLSEKRPLVAFENSIYAPTVHGFTLEEIAAFFAALDYVPMNFIGEPINPVNWFGFFEAWVVPRESVGHFQSVLRRSLESRGF